MVIQYFLHEQIDDNMEDRFLLLVCVYFSWVCPGMTTEFELVPVVEELFKFVMTDQLLRA
jgi:hypothetical protein